MTPEYLLALPVDPMPKDASYPQGTQLPLHCTLMHWFCFGNKFDLLRLDQVLTVFATKVRGGIPLASRHFELFGKNNDVPCHVLERSGPLLLLHTRIFKFLVEAGSAPEELQWVGAGYRPHVAMVGERLFPPGAVHMANSMVLVERFEGLHKQILRSYTFSR